MLLVHRARPAGIARAVSPPGELFVASVVIAMLLLSLGDALDPALFGEAGLEAGLFDLGGELSVLGLHDWHLLQLLLAGSVIAAGLAVLRAGSRLALKALRPAPPRSIDKVPI